MTNNAQNLDPQDDNQNYGTGSTSFGIPNSGDTSNRNFSDDVSDKDLNTEEDETTDDEDLDYDDDELSSDNDDTESHSGAYTTGVSDGAYDMDTDPTEVPDESEPDNNGAGYSRQTEVQQQQGGNDASYSEQNDVTPPNQHEFPSEGVATQTEFTGRPQGRTTGRMVGHEPGTEGI